MSTRIKIEIELEDEDGAAIILDALRGLDWDELSHGSFINWNVVPKGKAS